MGHQWNFSNVRMSGLTPFLKCPNVRPDPVPDPVPQSISHVDMSSNEHEILRQIFEDPFAISTVKLLQLAHLEHQSKGLQNEGFLVFSTSTFEAAENTPEAAQSLYFDQLSNLNLQEEKKYSQGQWDVIKKLLTQDDLSDFSYAYMTPVSVLRSSGNYKETGSLILNPNSLHALISSNNLILNGGLGSRLPEGYCNPKAISEWKLVFDENSYKLQSSFKQPPRPVFTGTTQWKADVRQEHKSLYSGVGDPIDIVTGAFYIDEIDLILPGSFPLKIRRNYNNQNPLQGVFGYGWKLSLNPSLVEQDNLRYAAEEDGTVISYRFNEGNMSWEFTQVVVT